MTIIDCHTHLGRNHHVEATPKNLLLSMDEAKIDKSLVFAGMLNDASNEWMLEQIAPYSDRLLGVAAAHPMSVNAYHRLEDAMRIGALYRQGKIVACKFYTGYDHYFPNSPVIEDYLSHFQEIGLPVIFHMGDCVNSAHHAKLKYAHPLHIDDVAVDYPNLNIVIAHMAYPWHRDAAEVCYKNANVYADISGFVYGDFSPEDNVKFAHVIKEFNTIADSTKLLFGTDFPISNQKSYVEAVDRLGAFHKQFEMAALSANVKRAFKL